MSINPKNVLNKSKNLNKRVDVEKNAWKCARCGGIWYVREGKQPHPQNVQYCFVCGSQVVDILDENGKSIKDGQTA